jgi:hypothetical protein
MRLEGLLMKLLAVGLIVLVAVIAGVTWAALHWTYSNGQRAGYVQKLSAKGWPCRTWEGEMAMVTSPGSVATEKFRFTVPSDAVAARLNASAGKLVALQYAQHKLVWNSCFGDSEYFITGVRVLK